MDTQPVKAAAAAAAAPIAVVSAIAVVVTIMASQLVAGASGVTVVQDVLAVAPPAVCPIIVVEWQ